MSERCETCRFYHQSDRACIRYPTTVDKRQYDWCGEWQAKREPAKPKEREPGWYWVRVRCKGFENDWLVAEWVGAEKPWWRLGDWGHGLVDADLLEIDERRIERAP